jgi:RNA polymerase sigma factor (sigma-70 family)
MAQAEEAPSAAGNTVPRSWLDFKVYVISVAGLIALMQIGHTHGLLAYALSVAMLYEAHRAFEPADDAMYEEYAAALEIWQREGVPANPRAWLVSTGKFKAINALRRQGRLKELQPEIASRVDEVAEENAARAATEIEDDRLRLIFSCCHPATDPKLQVLLTLREVCGLTTEEIALAFLTSKATMAQRFVRGKAKIRDEQIPYVVPSLADLRERLDAVLFAIYLVFGNPCPGRHRRPDGLESDRRPLLRAAAHRFSADHRTQSGRRGRDAGRTGSGAGPDRCDSNPRGLGGISHCPRGARGVVSALRKNVRREQLV